MLYEVITIYANGIVKQGGQKCYIEILSGSHEGEKVYGNNLLSGKMEFDKIFSENEIAWVLIEHRITSYNVCYTKLLRVSLPNSIR